MSVAFSFVEKRSVSGKSQLLEHACPYCRKTGPTRLGKKNAEEPSKGKIEKWEKPRTRSGDS